MFYRYYSPFKMEAWQRFDEVTSLNIERALQEKDVGSSVRVRCKNGSVIEVDFQSSMFIDPSGVAYELKKNDKKGIKY